VFYEGSRFGHAALYCAIQRPWQGWQLREMGAMALLAQVDIQKGWFTYADSPE